MKSWLTGKDPDAGKDWGQEEKGTTEDEMVGWHHWLNGHEFEQTQGDSEGQESLTCCSPWGHQESDMTERLNNHKYSFTEDFCSLSYTISWPFPILLNNLLDTNFVMYFLPSVSPLIIDICNRLPSWWEKAMAPHSNTLAWKTPWTEEPGRLQSMGSQRVGHDWATSLSLFIFMHWRRKWQPTPVFLPGESQGQGSLVGCCLWGHTEPDMTEAT